MTRHFSMLRDFQLADWFTLTNAFCGTGAVFAAMRFLQEGRTGDLLLGMALIPLAFVFDALDGRIARWRKSSSTPGRELDSLADVISFGVAPAALAYACGMQGGWDWLVLSYFVGCGVSRLTRYNVTAEALSEGEDKVKYFEGTPIPTSLALSCCWRSPPPQAGSARTCGGATGSWGRGGCTRWCCCSPCPVR